MRFEKPLKYLESPIEIEEASLECKYSPYPYIDIDDVWQITIPIEQIIYSIIFFILNKTILV